MLRPVAFSELDGWAEHDHASALKAFRRSCEEIIESGNAFSRPVAFGGIREAWLPLCREALKAQSARVFFEKHFRPWRVVDPARPGGLFTGYYEPEVEGSRKMSDEFCVPLYRPPADLTRFSAEEREISGLSFGRLVEGSPQAYFTRREIESGALAGRGLELVWLRDWADAFFIHVQGSGRVRLAEGGLLRLTYAAKSGLPYTSIGALLAERGEIPHSELSMQAIRRWMAAHADRARSLMWENRSFIFFREVELEDPCLGALGAQQVQLTPRRSIAVDRSIWMFGTPIWLDTMVPAGQEGVMTEFRQLLIAQDTGSAITGAARGDVYWGHGEAAASIAGPMKSTGTMTVLLPDAVTNSLGLSG